MNEYDSEDVQNAMKQEIKKFSDFEAYEEVEDHGQHRIPIRWVVGNSKS